VSTDDLARIAIASTTAEKARNRVLPVGGPEILKREEIPRIFGRIFNREPFILNPPLLAFDGLRGAINLLNRNTGSSLGTLRTLLANEFFCTPAEVEYLESTFNLKLETLEGFLRRYLGV
ncbi:MAG: SDR family NAD(P)-dependent oxidoreductase, partial [Leptolyngbyaceae cyanobacterium RU_5_1]|nr:SDR family NAD(P)-dependent oxidoreductase [Leptolyngbyaceae cyanobacterium RU_5_1]